MTAGMLAKGWNVTSVIRDQRQAANILKLGAGTPGNINTVVADLKDKERRGCEDPAEPESARNRRLCGR